jgi:hypothetical protein
MTAKTPAEIQIEFLKKLKAEQKSGKSARQNKVRARELAAVPDPTLQWRLSASRTQKKGRRFQPHHLSVSQAAWQRLQERLKQAGLSLKARRQLGDWAVELLLAFPLADSLSPEVKSDLFQRIGEWKAARGLK